MKFYPPGFLPIGIACYGLVKHQPRWVWVAAIIYAAGLWQQNAAESARAEQQARDLGLG